MNQEHDPHEDAMTAWLRGELTAEEETAWIEQAGSGPRAAEVEAHRRVLAELRALPREIEPPRDLYPAIAARLAPARRRSFWPLAAAAALMLLAGLALLMRLQRAAPPAPTPDAAIATAPAPRLPGDTAIARTAYRDTDLALAGIRRELRRSIEARQADLPPATRELVFENLRVIDEAIADIEAALAAAPADQALARTYIDYREREIELLRQVNRLAAKL